MKSAKKLKPSAPVWMLGAFLEDDAFNQIEYWLEQVEELVRMVQPENHDRERAPTLTVLNLVEEKAGQISKVLHEGYSRYAPPRKVSMPAPRRSAGSKPKAL